MKTGGLIIMLLGLYFSVRGQSFSYPRDTSYSIRSAWTKIKKDYPEVTPVAPATGLNITALVNQVYSTPGRPLTADVFLPGTDSTRSPAVLLIYGGGWSSGEKANQVPMAQQLASHGYVAVVAEYRLSPEARYPAAVEDLKNALRWMRSRATEFALDTSRIAVLGCSAGAQLATLLGVTSLKDPYNTSRSATSARVQAIVNIDGIVSFIHPEAEEGTYAARWLGGSRKERAEIWKEASPLEYAGSDTPPILFINSSHPRFHAGRDDMLSILDQHGIYSEVHTLENAPHSFWLVHPWFEPTVTYTLEFLDMVFDRKNN